MDKILRRSSRFESVDTKIAKTAGLTVGSYQVESIINRKLKGGNEYLIQESSFTKSDGQVIHHKWTPGSRKPVWCRTFLR